MEEEDVEGTEEGVVGEEGPDVRRAPDVVGQDGEGGGRHYCGEEEPRKLSGSAEVSAEVSSARS